MPEPKKNLTVRLDDRTREMLQLIADREMRPLANQIVFFIKQGVDTYLERNDLEIVENKDPETGELVALQFKDSPPAFLL